MRFILLLFIFIPFISCNPAFAAEEHCEDLIRSKTFEKDGYEVLKIAEPLTPEEASRLHKKLVQFKNRLPPAKFPYTFVLKRAKFDPVFSDRSINIYIEETPELSNMQEMQKLMMWTDVLAAKVDKKLRLNNEDPRVQMQSIVLNVGTSEDPLYREGTLPQHADAVYARVINSLLGSTTPVHDETDVLHAQTLESLLITGTHRFLDQRILATTHSSPLDNETDRLLLRMTFGYSTQHASEYQVPQTSNKLHDISGIRTNRDTYGIEFLKKPISISKSEAQQLVDSIRHYYTDIRQLPISTVNVAVLDEKENWENFQQLGSNTVIQQYLLKEQHPVFLKIRDQVSQIIADPEKYLELDGQPCEKITVGLRIGFKESRLYKGTTLDRSFEKYHQDRNFSRILAPLLGLPTEIYSKELDARMNLPMGTGTLITGTLSDENAIWHRAPLGLDEDRVLLVVTCTEETQHKRNTF